MAIFFLFLITVLLIRFTFDLMLDLLQEGGLVEENYLKQVIPTGYGLIFGINLIVILVLGSLIGIYEFIISTKVIFLALTMTLIGIIDDTLGQRNFQGFKGHIKALLWEQKLTTGFLKMFFSFILIFYLFFDWYLDFSLALIATLIVLLGANFINLLDVRPGRALKVFIFLGTLIILNSAPNSLLLLPLLIMAVFFLPVDLNAQGMMGDVGSNILGAVLGFIFVINASELTQLLGLVGLIIINLYAEIYSFTKLIANNKLLNFIDHLGRR